MSSRKERNLKVAQRYVELYNTDPERFVRECYHDDYKVGAMGVEWFDGIENFIEIEKAVLAVAPSRLMKVDHMHATEDAVIVEARIVDQDRGEDWSLPMCAVLEIRDDKIAVDRTYADFKEWPGFAAEDAS